jgi:hypothetical protein
MGRVVVQEDRLILLGIAIVLTFALWAFTRFTRIGLAISASAENERAVSALGWSPNLLASVTWAIGGATAGFAGILLAPNAGLSLTVFTIVVTVSALAVALIGGFSSFPLTLLGGIALGIAETEVLTYSGDITTFLHDHAPPRAVEPEPAVQRVVVRRQELVDLMEVVVPELLPREALEHDQHAERGHEAHERCGLAHEPQDAVLDDEPEQGREHDRHRDRCPHGPPVVADQREEAEEGGEHGDGAVREVHDPGPAVDEHDALREQRVRRTRPESEDRELDRLSHASLSRSSTRGHRATHLMYCVTSIGVLFVTMFLPSNREMYT